MSNKSLTLKQRFIAAINAGELGILDDYGVLVTQKAFSMYFSDVKTQYIYSFLSAATIDKSRPDATRTKYLFRLKRGFTEFTLIFWIKSLKKRLWRVFTGVLPEFI